MKQPKLITIQMLHRYNSFGDGCVISRCYKCNRIFRPGEKVLKLRGKLWHTLDSLEWCAYECK